MKKVLKKAFKIVLVLFLLGLLYLNIFLYYQPSFKTIEGQTYNEDVFQQLQFLKEEMHDGAGMKMQKLFPEGFIFIHALYGLTWCNLIQGIDKNTPIYQEGIQEIDFTLKEVNSSKGRAIFFVTLPLEYGVFYKGWSNYLLGKKLMVQAQADWNANDLALFKKNCVQIATAMRQSTHPYLESYRDNAWPADMTLAIASIHIYDQLFEPLYQQDIKNWIAQVKTKLDPETGLIPHMVDAKTGTSIRGAKGNSQSLILNFLKDIDPNFAKEQFAIYKNLFLDQRFFLPGIREYPKGKNGRADIDSGPVILGIGGAASIVGQRTMGQFGEWEIYEGLRNCIESFGASITFSSKKEYIFGTLPMADAFIAWSNSLEKSPKQYEVHQSWRLKFQLLSLFLIAIAAFLLKNKQR